jgi:hypothetical protein
MEQLIDAAEGRNYLGLDATAERRQTKPGSHSAPQAHETL